MTLVHRVLPPGPWQASPTTSTAVAARGIQAALAAEPEALIAEVEASGLRRRGGAGFPTGTKWRTRAESRYEALPTTVVVNGAEGDAGTFKDRTTIRTNPLGPFGPLEAASGRATPAVRTCRKRYTQRIRQGSFPV